MNRQTDNPIERDTGVKDTEATLRLIANLPAPAGIEDRVHAALANAATRKPGRVLEWPSARKSTMSNAWLRSAAAAAIAVVVVGGGWGVYSRVQPWQRHTMPVPVHDGAQGGFGGAGAIRTPQTLNGPVLTHPVKAEKKTAEVPVKKKSAPQEKR